MRTAGSTDYFAQSEKILPYPDSDTSSALAQCGIVRTKDFSTWERPADFVDTFAAAAECGSSSGTDSRKICFLYEAAGRLY